MLHKSLEVFPHGNQLVLPKTLNDYNLILSEKGYRKLVLTVNYALYKEQSLDFNYFCALLTLI